MSPEAISEKLVELCETACRSYVEHAVKIEHLQDGQREQAGALKEICKEVKNMNGWVMRLFGGMVVSLILLIFNLLAR